MKRIACMILTICLLSAAIGFAQQTGKSDERSRPQPDRIVEFKTFDEGDPITLHVFEPAGYSTSGKIPAIVFFFGGGWNGGTPAQFHAQAEYFASRGILAISAQYRQKQSHGVLPFECVADGKSAIRWVRAHAKDLGIDPDRIAAGGGSAGGHVAASTAVIKGFEDEKSGVSSQPNALVLFNPALYLDSPRMAQRLNNRQLEISPAHHVRKGLPPTIIFHGEADTTVPFETATDFTEKMHKAGNKCELVPFPGESHGFFNWRETGDNAAYKATVRAADVFLTKLGYLSGKPTIK